MLQLGIAIIAMPTLVRLATQLWSTEDGAHGPIILVTGLWLFFRSLPKIALVARPGNARIAMGMFLLSLIGYVFARITSMLGVECLALLAALISVYYYHVGWPGLRLTLFPFVYLLFMFPMPETITLPITHFLKLQLSDLAVSLLSWLGYEVGRGGVIIYIDQYELFVKDSCSGMNSLIGLSSIGIFYAYLQYNGRWKDSWPLLIAIAPIAVSSNFIRLMIMILVTHYEGDETAQHYVHDPAAAILFTAAMVQFFAWDLLVQRFQHRKRG